MRAFFGLGDPFERHSKLLNLVSGSYWKNQLLSPVITRSINSGSAATCSCRSAQILNRASCCCSVRFLGTILAQIFLTPNSSVSIKRAVSRLMFNLSAITWTVNRRSDRTSSLTPAVFSPVRAVAGRPLRWSSSARFLPSENILCQRKAYALDIASSPNACWSFPCVVIALSPSLTQKRHNYARRSLLSWPRQGSHKQVLTLQACTPHWGIAKPCHCKWAWRKDQGQRLSVLAGCSIANTARRKLSSLLYCRTSYAMGHVRYGVVFCNPQYSAKHIQCHVRDCVVLSPILYIYYIRHISDCVLFVPLSTRYMTCVMLVTMFCFVSLSTKYVACVMSVTVFCFVSLSTRYMTYVMLVTAFCFVSLSTR